MRDEKLIEALEKLAGCDPFGRGGAGYITNEVDARLRYAREVLERHKNTDPAYVLELARHELVALGGLEVCDGAAPGERWRLDTSGIVARIDAALEGMGKELASAR